MTYTFDELEKKLEEALDSIGAPTEASDKIDNAVEILYKLREEYAPTVEMTEAQREYWEKANENNFKALDKKTTSGLFVADMPDKKTTLTLTVRQSINALLHPETIKMVDE